MFEVGDKVIYEFGYKMFHTTRLATVSRVTPKRAYIRINEKSERSFNRETGNGIGTYEKIVKATDEDVLRLRAEARKVRIISYLQHTNWSKYSLEKLERIEAILNEEQKLKSNLSGKGLDVSGKHSEQRLSEDGLFATQANKEVLADLI